MATEIHDVTDLQAINDNLSGDYELANDIDASETSTWNAGAGFVPIGTFTGSFAGKGYTITGLHINRPSTDDVGLFGYCQEATIRNVNIVDAEIHGDRWVGVLIGDAYETLIEDCLVTGVVNGDRWVGGLAGRNEGAPVRRCVADVAVEATNENTQVGGLIGRYPGWGLEGDVIEQCSAAGNVLGSGDCGGLIGEATAVLIRECYATGDVTDNSNTFPARFGGLIGTFGAGQLRDCYARGTISSTFTYPEWPAWVGNIGGLVGYVYSSAGDPRQIDSSYSTGVVSGAQHNIGGLIGDVDGAVDVLNSFWDTQTSGQATSDGGEGKTTAEMKEITTFSAWDIATSPVSRNDGYPFLSWEIGSSPIWLITSAAIPDVPDSPRRTVAVEDIITLQSIRNVQMSAMGEFYIDEEGNAVYSSRYGRNP